MANPRRILGSCALGLLLAATAAACGDDTGDTTAPSASAGGEPVTVRLLTHDSFVLPDDAFDALRAEGIEVEILTGGDAGALTNSVVLDAEAPQADAVYGIDNTFVGRALAAEAFAAHDYDVNAVRPELTEGIDVTRIVPIDYGDVCVNYDAAWFAERDVDPPAVVDDLLRADLAGLTVVQDANLSSPGLAFVLATQARDPGGWEEWWRSLVDNDVLVVSDWTTAWSEFTAGGGEGQRPIVVSYATSPPADVVYSDPPRETTRIEVVDDGCFRQVEYAGVLRNAAHPDAAARVVEHLLDPAVQAEVPLNMFVWPARADVAEPEVFTRFALHATDPVLRTPDEIDAVRDAVLDAWTEVALT